MKRFVCFLFILVASCQSFSKSEKPDDFYGDEKMAQIMADLYLYEGVVSSNRAMLRKEGIFATDLIYQKYQTDSITYSKNFYYYADREEEYLTLMDRVQELLEREKDSVSKRQDEINKETEQFKSTPNTKDSLPKTEKKILQERL